MDEVVGKIVTKKFTGFGVFKGVVESYDSSTGFFRIVYEDGDSEEADLSEVYRLLSSSTSDTVAHSIAENQKVATTKKVGRKPKRRRRNDPGIASDSLEIDNSQRKLVIDNVLGCSVVNEFNDCGNVNGKLDGIVGNGGLDLNRGLSFDGGVDNVEIRGCIDLNLRVDDDDDDGVDENESRVEKVGSLGKKERGFDLNLGLNEESMNGENGTMDTGACIGSGEEVKNGETSVVTVVDANHVNSRVCDAQLEGGCLEAVTPNQCQDGNSGRKKKKRKVERNLNSPTETVLRRSARRAKVAVADENLASSAVVEDEANDLSVSGIIDESEEKPVPQVLETPAEPPAPPSKIELPPSSANLNLEGIPVLDLFSVYACLRSFSTVLYLSPFELDDLVAALKSRVSNQLIDCIHVSILQTLRIHLELLASEGCDSATSCLRNLNWDLLDVITWPVFMVEYLLIHGSGLKPGFTLNHLKLFDAEYYKQPAEVKIELLRCLCDDVVEVEAIRSDLSKRTIIAEANMEAGRMMCNERKRKTSLEGPGVPCLSEDVKEEIADGNSDECCLCKMDGNLICCDSCPAAYHSKCVGIVSSLLPEGDWYCPECVIGKLNFVNKPQKFIRGAELLGTDPYGRLFFRCFDYLLVSDSIDADASCSYYHKDDFGAVIQLLRSSSLLYGSIISAIFRHWDFPTDLCPPKSDMGSENRKLKEGANDGKKTKRYIISRYSGHLSSEISGPADLFGSDTAEPLEAENIRTSSEGSGEVLQENQLIQKSHRPVSNIAARRTSGKSGAAFKQRKKKGSFMRKGSSDLKAKEEGVLQGQSGDGYMNSYSFARIASSVVEELLRKPSGKVNIDVPKTEEEIISIQLKFILKKSAKSCWTTIQDLNRERQREECGWCYCCRFPVEGRGCLFSVKNGSSVPDALKVEIDSVLSKRNKKGHLVDVICYILCMEERLRGFLSGPWLRPQYSELWCQRVLKSSDVSSLKLPLLTLESNLRPLALSADWWKHVDLVTTMGSASHFVASSRATSKNNISRKKVRCADSETKSSTAGSGLVLFWWRGGRTSRSLFNWKVIPRSSALKVARKAGRMKIPDLQYSDASESTRRTKCVAWRAAVESSTNLGQLALQVREFDLFIRWDDIENTHPHSLLDKESIKSIRLFKKVIIRRKSLVGTVARYLLDFGKRRSVPDVVLKHGHKFEESDCERKKFWLDEVYVPLYLLKSFEERRITRKAGKKNSSKSQRGVKLKKKSLREKGFDYLFSRAERADGYQCGHCNKNVMISEAVSCQLCNGYFHKRHVMKSSEGITAVCTYTCHRCRAGKNVKKESNLRKRKFSKLRDAKDYKADSKGPSAMLKVKPRKKGKKMAVRRQVLVRNAKKMQYNDETLAQKKTNVSTGITLRRSARKSMHTPVQPTRFVEGKKGKRKKPRNVASKVTPKGVSWQNKRTQILHSFWINGLLLSRKPNDERVAQFKKRKVFVPSGFPAQIADRPKCSICSQQGSMSALMYIACEICGDWFHGDAFGLDEGNIKSLIGFKCHVCRGRSPPVCPLADILRDNDTLLIEASSEAQDAQGLPEVVAVQTDTDTAQELQCNEGFSGVLEVHTEQNCDGNLDQDETPTLIYEVRVESGSPTGKEVVSCSRDNTTLFIGGSSDARDAQGLPEVVAVQKETDCVLEFQCNERSSGLLEVHTEQNCDKNLDLYETLRPDPELRVGNGSSSCAEVVSCSRNGTLYIEASSDALDARDAQGLPDVAVQKETNCMLEGQCNEGFSGLLQVPTEQDCDGNLDQDETPMLDSKVRVERGSPTSKEVVSCSRDNSTLFTEASCEVRDAQGLPEIIAVGKETDCVLELQRNEGSSGFSAIHIAQNCDGNLDKDATPMLDPELRVKNGTSTSKEVVFSSNESEDFDLDTKLLKESDENSFLEGNQIS